MAAGDIFSFTVVALQNAQPVASVFFLEVLDDTGTTDAMQDAADALDNQLLSTVRPFQATAVEYECILGRRVQPTTSPTRVFTLSSTGAIGFAPAPANVAFKFRHYSDVANPNQRGRYFLPGVTLYNVQNGRFTQNLDSLFQTFMTAAVGVLTDAGRTYRLKHHSRTAGLYWDVDSMTVDPVPVKVRNRTPGLCSIS